MSDADSITKGFWFDLSGVSKLYQYKADQGGTWVERTIADGDSLTLFRANNTANSPMYLSLVAQAGAPTAEDATGIIKVQFVWENAEVTPAAGAESTGPQA